MSKSRLAILLVLLCHASIARLGAQSPSLSPEERAWLGSLDRPIRVAPDPFFPPMEFLGADGSYEGIAIEYLRLIERKLGLSFELASLPGFEAVLEAARNREVDVGNTIVETPERSEYLLFTKPYISIPNVIVMRDDGPERLAPERLAGLPRVAYQAGYAIGAVLAERYGARGAQAVVDLESALSDLSLGRIDAVVGNLATISYYARRTGHGNLRVVGDCEYDDELRFAARSDWPMLASVLNKALDAIGQSDRDAIRDRWIGLRAMRFYEDPRFWLTLAGVAGVAGLALFLLYLWNRTLKAQVERRTIELRAKNEELSRFLYTASHDLRSPLVTIQAFVGYLERDLASGDEAARAQDLGYVKAAASKMALLLDEILALSRIGRESIVERETSLAELARMAVSLVAGRLEASGARVVIDERPLLIRGDQRRLVELFQNLVDNAAKFMGKRDDPTISIGFEESASGIRLYVKDNGRGIDERHRARLFGLFEKLDSTSEGSGMGLAIAKRIVETHGGRIWVESEGPGRGSAFYFTLDPGRLGARARTPATRVHAEEAIYGA